MKLRLTLFSLLLAAISFAAQGIQWSQTGFWKGCGTQQTEFFWLTGSEWFTNFRALNNTSVALTMYDANTGCVLLTQKGYINNNSYLASGRIDSKKQVYLQITAPAYPWSLQFRQYVSAIEAFNIHKRQKQPQPATTPFAAWTGDGGESLTQIVQVPSREWRISARLLKAGSLAVACTDKEGNVLAEFQLREPGITHSWIHTPSNVQIKVTSQKSPWFITIEMR